MAQEHSPGVGLSPLPGPLRLLPEHPEVDLLEGREPPNRRAEATAREAFLAARGSQLQVDGSECLGDARATVATGVQEALKIILERSIEHAKESHRHVAVRAVGTDHGPDVAADDQSVSACAAVKESLLDHAGKPTPTARITEGPFQAR